MIQIQCKNCGAELTGDVCEYCGTRYNNVSQIDKHTFKLDYDGKTYRVFLTEVEKIRVSPSDITRNHKGELVCCPPTIKHKFTFLEL